MTSSEKASDKKGKHSRKRAGRYEEKLKVKGSFLGVLRVAVKPKEEDESKTHE